MITPEPWCAINCTNRNMVAFTQKIGIKFCRFPTSHSTSCFPTTRGSYRDSRLRWRHYTACTSPRVPGWYNSDSYEYVHSLITRLLRLILARVRLDPTQLNACLGWPNSFMSVSAEIVAYKPPSLYECTCLPVTLAGDDKTAKQIVKHFWRLWLPYPNFNWTWPNTARFERRGLVLTTSHCISKTTQNTWHFWLLWAAFNHNFFLLLRLIKQCKKIKWKVKKDPHAWEDIYFPQSIFLHYLVTCIYRKKLFMLLVCYYLQATAIAILVLR